MMSFYLSGGVEVLGFISPTEPTDEYPVIDPLYGIDGFRNVNTLSDLNSIPNLRRRAGMVVGVSGGTQYYKLNPSPWNGTITDWSTFNSGSGGGTFTGGTVTGDTIFTQGLTATTFSASTYLGLPLDVYVTGGTYSNGTIIFTNTSGGTFNVVGLNTGTTINLSGGTGISVSGTSPNFIVGNTLPDQIVNLSGGTNIKITGTYPNFGVEFTGTTSGSFTGGTVTGNTIFTQGVTATTFSASTYLGLPLDVYVTGGTYSNGTITFTNNSGGTFDVSGLLTGITETQVTGFTYQDNTFTISDTSGNTFSTTIDTMTGLTVNGVLSATTYQNLPQYYAGVISGSTNWINNNNGSITLPNLQVALFSTPDFSGPLNLYDILSTTLVLNNEDTNYIGVDYNNGSPIYFLSNNDGLINDSNVILYLIVYRTNNFLHILEFGDYGSGLPNKLNDRVLMTDRFAHESGCILGLSGSTGIVILTDGIVWNGVNREIISAVTSNDGVFFQNYHVNGNWVYTTTASTLNNQFYDDGTNLVSATTGNYLVNWYFRGQEVNDHLYEVFGNNEYVSVAAAELSLEPLLPELITSHAFIVGRIIVGVGQTTGLTQTAFVTPFVSTQVTNHQDLLGLQGGGPGQYYHLSSNEYNNLAYTNVDNNFSADQTINGGLTATTISATTYLNVNAVTGGSYYNGVITLSGTGNVNGTTITGLLSSVPFLRNETTPSSTDTIQINESIFNPSNLTVLNTSIFIVDTNADYYILGDLYNYGNIIVDGVLKVGGTIYNYGTITGSGIIE